MRCTMRIVMGAVYGSVEYRKQCDRLYDHQQKVRFMNSFEGRHFPKNIILMPVRWYVAYLIPGTN